MSAILNLQKLEAQTKTGHELLALSIGSCESNSCHAN
jgi:hypothetical protein